MSKKPPADENPMAIVQAEFPHPLADLADAVAANVAASVSPRTLRAYRSDWKTFSAWCETRGLLPMPAHPQVIATYITWLDAQGRAVSTIARALVSIGQAHQAFDHESPTADRLVRKTMKGIRRNKGSAQKAAVPLLPAELRQALPESAFTNRRARDRAMLCLGLAGGFRASELVALLVGDVRRVDEGLVVLVRFSKTDQEGQGRRVGIPWGTYRKTCPVCAVTEWIDELVEWARDRGELTGPLLRSVTEADEITDNPMATVTVTRAVRRVLREAGMDTAGYSSHSLRAGFVTAAAQAGKRMERIMQQTGHKSVQVMQGYVREATLFDDNPAKGIGL
jgi:site-specific recombinase XerD